MTLIKLMRLNCHMGARDNYHGLPITDYHKFDIELVSRL